jgi:cytochrome b561
MKTYNRTAISLHWLVALGLAGTFALGFYMSDLPFSPVKLHYFSWHKWAGVTLFALILFRLVWRLAHGAPAAPAGLPAWQAAAAEWTHRVLYILMLSIPLSGWLMSSALGIQTVYFGLLPIPDLLAKNPDLGHILARLHGVLNFAMLALVFLHVSAAIKHHVIDRDEVLARMLPFLKKH